MAVLTMKPKLRAYFLQISSQIWSFWIALSLKRATVRLVAGEEQQKNKTKQKTLRATGTTNMLPEESQPLSSWRLRVEGGQRLGSLCDSPDLGQHMLQRCFISLSIQMELHCYNMQ